MALKQIISSVAGLDSNIAQLYKQGEDGKYHLDLEPVEQDHDKNVSKDRDTIPRSRLNQEIEKRKSVEKALQEVAEQLIEDVPEEKRSIIPDLPAPQKISWLKTAFKMDFFSEKQPASLDTNRPGDKSPTNIDSLSPQQKMAQGYKTK